MSASALLLWPIFAALVAIVLYPLIYRRLAP
jgi:hypothetical protein